MLMLDLCAGKKGASRAMVDRGWEVITVDVEESFQPDVLADVRSWRYQGPRPDLVWCSPPCDQFSREFMPWCKTGIAPDLSVVEGCKRFIESVQPRYWVIENVKGAVEWFRPILGKPSYICNPYFLWGSFPDISHVRVRSKKEHLSSSAAAERAVIPYRISEGLAVAIEQALPLPAFQAG